MASTLLVYFILTASLRWEFYSIETISGDGARDYCEQQAGNVAALYQGKPGNMRVVCADDLGVEI